MAERGESPATREGCGLSMAMSCWLASPLAAASVVLARLQMMVVVVSRGEIAPGSVRYTRSTGAKTWRRLMGAPGFIERRRPRFASHTCRRPRRVRPRFCAQPHRAPCRCAGIMCALKCKGPKPRAACVRLLPQPPARHKPPQHLGPRPALDLPVLRRRHSQGRACVTYAAGRRRAAPSYTGGRRRTRQMATGAGGFRRTRAHANTHLQHTPHCRARARTVPGARPSAAAPRERPQAALCAVVPLPPRPQVVPQRRLQALGHRRPVKPRGVQHFKVLQAGKRRCRAA